jgi:hypothetical protein
VDKNAAETLNEIETAQAGFRTSIETTKKLAAQSDQLLKRFRKEVEEGS